MRLIGIVGALLGVVTLATSAAADQQTQTLVCRGGGQMRLTINHGRDPSGAQLGAIVIVQYKKAAAPANVSPPGVGECALLTQAFKPSDPDTLFLKSKRAEAVLDLWGDGRVVIDSAGPHAHGDSPDINERRLWDAVLQGTFSGQPFSLTVYPPVQVRGEPAGWLAVDLAPVPAPPPQN